MSITEKPEKIIVEGIGATNKEAEQRAVNLKANEQHQIDTAARLILEARALKLKQKAIEHELQSIQRETLFVGAWLNTENTYVVISDERGLHLTELTPCIKKPKKPECPPNILFKETDL